MAAARAMLSKPDMTVSEVALSFGFATSQSFARAFRREYGIAPSYLLSKD
jgi:AraC-like DNA-binding protein